MFSVEKCPNIGKIIIACCCFPTLVSARSYELLSEFGDCADIFLWQGCLLS